MDFNTEIYDLHHNHHVSMGELARRYNLTHWKIKTIVDPNFLANRQKLRRMTTQVKRSKNTHKIERRTKESNNHPTYDPRRDGTIFHKDWSSFAMGDPLPGRSALDQRRNGSGV